MFKKTFGWVMVGWMLFILLLFMPMPVAAITIPETHCITPGCDDPAPRRSTPPRNNDRRDREDAEAAQQQQRERDKITRYNAIREQANAEIEKGNYQEALRLCREMGKIFKSMPETLQKSISWLESTILGNDYNQQANAANANHDYKKALKLYKKALATYSNPDPEYRKFVADYERAVPRYDKIARTFDRVVDIVSDNRPAPPTPGLEFMKESPRAITTDAGSQLKSVKRHGDRSLELEKEPSKDESGKGFDTVGTYSGNLVYPDKTGNASSSFASRIPSEGLKDDQVRQSLAYYDKLDRLKVETASKIASIKEQQKSGTGDTAIQLAQLATLENQLNQYNKDQDQAKKDIGKRLKDIKLDWKEELPPNEGDINGTSK